MVEYGTELCYILDVFCGEDHINAQDKKYDKKVDYCLDVLSSLSNNDTIVYLGSRVKNVYKFLCKVSNFDELNMLCLNGTVLAIKQSIIYTSEGKNEEQIC